VSVLCPLKVRDGCRVGPTAIARVEMYRYASLNDRDTFREMRRQAIPLSCERHTVYLHKPR